MHEIFPNSALPIARRQISATKHRKRMVAMLLYLTVVFHFPLLVNLLLSSFCATGGLPIIALAGIGVGGFIVLVVPFTIVCIVKKKRQAGKPLNFAG